MYKWFGALKLMYFVINNLRLQACFELLSGTDYVHSAYWRLNGAYYMVIGFHESDRPRTKPIPRDKITWASVLDVCNF